MSISLLTIMKENQKGLELFNDRESLDIKELEGKKLTLSNVDLLENVTDKFSGELKSVIILGFEEYPKNFVFGNNPITNFFLDVLPAGEQPLKEKFKALKKEICDNHCKVEIQKQHNKKFNNDYYWVKIL